MRRAVGTAAERRTKRAVDATRRSIAVRSVSTKTGRRIIRHAACTRPLRPTPQSQLMRFRHPVRNNNNRRRRHHHPQPPLRHRQLQTIYPQTERNRRQGPRRCRRHLRQTNMRRSNHRLPLPLPLRQRPPLPRPRPRRLPRRRRPSARNNNNSNSAAVT